MGAHINLILMSQRVTEAQVSPILRLLLAMGLNIKTIPMSLLATGAQVTSILRILLVMEAHITLSLCLPLAMGA